VAERQRANSGFGPLLSHRLRAETSARGDAIYDSLLARAGYKVCSRGTFAKHYYSRHRALVVRLKGRAASLSR